MIYLILFRKKNFHEEVFVMGFYKSVEEILKQHKQNQNQNQNQNPTGFFNRLLNNINNVLCACSSNQTTNNESDTELDLTKPSSGKKQER